MKKGNGTNIVLLLCNWIMNFSTINLIWFTINIPIFLLLIICFITNFISLTLILILFLLMPILFFPSTTAMFDVIRDWIIDDQEKPIISSYYLKFKQNFKKSFISGMLFSIIWAIVGIDFYYFIKNDYTALIIATFFLLLFLFVMTINFFSITSHYHLNIKDTFQTALITTVGKPLTSLVLLLINGIIIFISLEIISLVPFFTGISISYFSFSLFYGGGVKSKSSQSKSDDF